MINGHLVIVRWRQKRRREKNKQESHLVNPETAEVNLIIYLIHNRNPLGNLTTVLVCFATIKFIVLKTAVGLLRENYIKIPITSENSSGFKKAATAAVVSHYNSGVRISMSRYKLSICIDMNFCQQNVSQKKYSSHSRIKQKICNLLQFCSIVSSCIYSHNSKLLLDTLRIT